MTFKTVQEGEQAVILNHLGEGRLIVGPSRVSGIAVVELPFQGFDGCIHAHVTKKRILRSVIVIFRVSG